MGTVLITIMVVTIIAAMVIKYGEAIDHIG